MAFKEQLVKLRKKKGITQGELASQIGVRQYVISSWETGRSEPSIHQLMMLGDILEVPTDYLLDKAIIRASSEEEFNRTIEMVQSDADVDFLNSVTEMCSSLSDAQKERLLAVIKSAIEFSEE